MDELLLGDCEDLEMVDPEYLPRNVLHDFAFYNSEVWVCSGHREEEEEHALDRAPRGAATLLVLPSHAVRRARVCACVCAQGFLSTLELVPMFNGLDHDVDIFGSGVVVEDMGDFMLGAISTLAPTPTPAPATDAPAPAAEGGAAGAAAPMEVDGAAAATAPAGGSGAGGSGAGGAAGAATTAAAVGGPRVYLSQIREWCVELAADQLAINIRTDMAWYRLVT